MAAYLQKIISLSFADRSVEALEHLKHVFPDLAFFRRCLVSEQVRRMIGDHSRNAVVSVPAAAQLAHCAAHSKQAFNSNCAERDQHARLNNIDLFHQIRAARLHFSRRRRPIPKTARRCVRPAFKDVRDVNVFSREIHRLNNFCQQLSGASDEWFALLIFVHTGRFTDEHQIGVGISYSEYCLRAGAGEMLTFRAGADALANRGEQFRFIL